jgi:hypothetical protein
MENELLGVVARSADEDAEAWVDQVFATREVRVGVGYIATA